MKVWGEACCLPLGLVSPLVSAFPSWYVVCLGPHLMFSQSQWGFGRVQVYIISMYLFKTFHLAVDALLS